MLKKKERCRKGITDKGRSQRCRKVDVLCTGNIGDKTFILIGQN
jgi:hypothetical protein